MAPEFVYGSGALALTGRYAKNFGAKKVLVVTDPGVVQAGWAEKAIGSLDAEHVPWAMFQDVTPNPKDHEVAAGVRFYQEHECDVIVAVGGGSPIDCAKGIAIASTNNRNVLEFEGVDQVPLPGSPLICIPTTSGTSADVSQFAIIRDTARKLKITIVSKTVVPDVSLIDPETATTMPAELTAATGLDALVHAIEAYVSTASSPITDLNALGAIPLLVQNLVPAIGSPKNIEYRNNMMLGSLLAGLAFSNAGLGLVHSMAHSMGGLLDSLHGLSDALLLQHVVDFNYSAAPERYGRIALAMGIKPSGQGPASTRDALLGGIAKLCEDVGIATAIGTLGVTAADIPQLSINAFNDPCSATNPRQASVEEIESIYERALMHSTADARPPTPGKPAPEKLRAYMEEGLQSEHVARSLREKITGLGERSIRKSYYPQLRQQLERLQVMAEELNHRVKNTLATVMALSTQTFRSAKSPEAFREAFEGRLLALSQTHNLLNRSSWTGVSLRDILRQELGPYDSTEGGRFLLDGNDLKLGPVMAVTLGMAFHELATNAAKYGALSAAGGKIRVVWRISSPGQLHLEWQEIDGPPVSPPRRRGFGSHLIEEMLAGDLDGEVRLHFLSEGVRCSMDLPLNRISMH